MRFWNQQPDNWRGRMGVWVYDDEDTFLKKPLFHGWVLAGQLRVFPAVRYKGKRARRYQLHVVAGVDGAWWRHAFPADGADAWCAWRRDGRVVFGAGAPGRVVQSCPFPDWGRT